MKAADHQPERRSGRRFAVHAPVFFTVWTKSGTSAPQTGTIRDVGPGGMFFRTPAGHGIERQSTVRVRFVIKRTGIPQSQPPVAVSADGKVLRKERISSENGNGGGGSSDEWGIAVQFVRRPQVDLASMLLDTSFSPSPS